jgi:hypothetical protein
MEIENGNISLIKSYLEIKRTDLTKEQFFKQIGNAFRAHPFVKAVVRLLQEKGTLHFGAVNAWITSNCSDRPTPSRWEIKPATNRLYEWLSHFYDEISWCRPNHSQILIWQNRT